MNLTAEEIAEAIGTIEAAIAIPHTPPAYRRDLITGAVLAGIEWHLNRIVEVVHPGTRTEHVRRALALIAARDRLLNEDTVDLADRREVAP